MTGALDKAILGGLKPFRHRAFTMEPQKLLVVHAGGIGDLLMATPALKALRKGLPQATIHFLGHPSAAPVLEGLGYFDRAIDGFDHTMLRRPTLSAKFLGQCSKLISTIGALRREEYDTLLLLQPLMSKAGAIRTAMVFGRLGIPNVVGRDTDGRGFFLTTKVPETFAGAKHEVERVLDVVESIGVARNGTKPEVAIPEAARQRARELLQAEGIDDASDLVVFCPGSRKESRKWPLERWAKLGDSLINELGVRVLISGDQAEAKSAEAIAKMMTVEPVLLGGRTSLMETAAIMDMSRVVVSVDSGPMHLASVLSPALVALFGPGHFDRVRPYGSGKRWAIVRQETECAPCYKDCCEEKKCMNAITVEAALQAVHSVW